jgi:hypothetical protein
MLRCDFWLRGLFYLQILLLMYGSLFILGRLHWIIFLRGLTLTHLELLCLEGHLGVQLEPYLPKITLTRYVHSGMVNKDHVASLKS